MPSLLSLALVGLERELNLSPAAQFERVERGSGAIPTHDDVMALCAAAEPKPSPEPGAPARSPVAPRRAEQRPAAFLAVRGGKCS